MRRLIVTTVLSLFLISGFGNAYADDHHGRNHDKDRKEYRQDKKHHDDKKRHDGKRHHEEKRRPNIKKGHGHPTPPPPPAPHFNRPRHYNHAYHYPHYSVHDNLGYMISRIVNGGRDVNVWQVNSNTYAVRFRKGNRMYLQYLYPYEGRYGKRSTISVNWAPLSPWALIPSVHLNINL